MLQLSCILLEHGYFQRSRFATRTATTGEEKGTDHGTRRYRIGYRYRIGLWGRG